MLLVPQPTDETFCLLAIALLRLFVELEVELKELANLLGLGDTLEGSSSANLANYLDYIGEQSGHIPANNKLLLGLGLLAENRGSLFLNFISYQMVLRSCSRSRSRFRFRRGAVV